MKVEKEHVQYDYDMFCFAVNNMEACVPQPILFNMLNTVAAVHSYNLLSYSAEYLGALPYDMDELNFIHTYSHKVEDQLLSLTPKRTAKFEEKLKDVDFIKMRDILRKHKDALGVVDK